MFFWEGSILGWFDEDLVNKLLVNGRWTSFVVFFIYSYETSIGCYGSNNYSYETSIGDRGSYLLIILTLVISTVASSDKDSLNDSRIVFESDSSS